MDEKELAVFFHDLRAPMVGIRGYLSMLLDGSFGELPDEAKKKLGMVQREAERLHGMIENVINESHKK